MPLRFERAQIGDRAREREGELLRLRAAGIVDDASVGDRERTVEAGSGELADQRGEVWRELVPGPRPAAGRGKAADRIEAEAEIDRCRRDAAAFDQRGEIADHVPRRGLRVEVERDAGIEIDAVEHARERCRRGSRPKPLAPTEPAKTSDRPVAPFSQIVQRLRVGGRRIGMIDALHDRPGARRARGRRWALRAASRG